MDVSVIIINYKTKKLTVDCIDSVYKNTDQVDFEIILVDNNSKDGTIEYISHQYPSVIIKEMEENVGFGRANNAGAELASGKYLFLLNSDTILLENTIKYFYEFMENNHEYSACGCNLIDADGNNVVCHGRLPSISMELFSFGLSRLFKRYYANHLALGQRVDAGDVNNTGYISGADVFIRASVFNQLDGFDPNIFMYFEETDLFARMRKRGLRSCVLPDKKIVHFGGASLGTINLNKIIMYESSRFYYYRKHFSAIQVFFVKVSRIINFILHPSKYTFSLIKAIVKL